MSLDLFVVITAWFSGTEKELSMSMPGPFFLSIMTLSIILRTLEKKLFTHKLTALETFFHILVIMAHFFSWKLGYLVKRNLHFGLFLLTK